MLRILIICVCVTWSNLNFHAQEVIGSGGDYFPSSNGSLSWTVGETVTETVSNAQGIFTQGFQQNYESIVSFETIHLTNKVLVFPNPFHSELNIHWESSDFSSLKISLSDTYGKVITEQHIQNSSIEKSTTLNVSGIADGVYYVTIYYQNRSTPIIYKAVKY